MLRKENKFNLPYILDQLNIFGRPCCDKLRIQSVTTPIHPVGIVRGKLGRKLRSTASMQ